MKCTDSLSNFYIKKAFNGQKVICRVQNKDADTEYAMVVVGYDDEIQCDVNRDGKIEKTEKGAFKLAT